MKTKMTYVAPETELIDLKLEQGILADSGTFTINGFTEDSETLSAE